MAAGKSDKPERQPINAATRRRLQQCFEFGSKAEAKGSYDYAADMYTQCVLGDPGNVIYARNFLGNLQKKYGNNKKGSKLAAVTGAPHRAAIKSASMQKDSLGVIKAGLELLKVNPWDTSGLAAVAAACAMLDYDESQLVYLKGALDVNIKDPEVNRLAGRALARQGKFAEAILCWKRVEAGKPKDEEASRAIADLMVERTIHEGGYEKAESATDVRADDVEQESGSFFTPERQLEKLIAKNPADIQNYVKLSELHLHNQRMEEAELWLTKAVAASGGDLGVKERLEDLRLRRVREQLEIAKRRAESEKTAEAVDLYKRFKAELNSLEMEYYRNRVDRYPQNIQYKFELGTRLQKAGNYKEAITLLQAARGDQQRKGLVLLGLGQCFYQIKQHKLAMANLEEAAREIPEKDLESKKLALYWAGALAQALKDLGKAESLFTELAGYDFGYKDVSERLDKIAELRDKGDSPSGT